MTTIKLKNGSGAPTSGDLVQGEPALDLTNKRLYTEDSGGTVIEVGTNPTSVTTGNITATGTATFAGLTTTADVSFGDSDKAVFGAGADLQIYHDGSNSYIDDTATGHLFIRSNGDGIYLRSNTNEEIAHFNVNGSVKAYYDNSLKLETTNTGIDITGTVNADGLTVDGKVLINTPASAIAQEIKGRSSNDVGYLQFSNNAGTTSSYIGSNGSYLNFEVGSAERMRITSGGNVGINTSNPSAPLNISATYSSDTTEQFRIEDNTGGKLDFFGYANGGKGIQAYADNGSTFYNLNLQPLGGSVGIGGSTITDSNLLNLQGSSASVNIGVVFNDTNTSKIFGIQNGNSALKFFDYTANAERMRIDSSGNVGINTTPSSWGGVFDTIDVGPYGSFSADNDTTFVTNNAYYNGPNWIYKNSNLAGRYRQQLGFHVWDTAASGTAGGTLTWSEAMRIDASGNLLVSKSSLDVGTVGLELRADGLLAATRSGSNVAVFRRLSDDGSIVDFQKDGSTVGSIGVSSGAYLTIGTGDTGILFDNAGNRFYPCNASTQANLDATIDIGASNVRFKDLHLSGATKLFSGTNSPATNSTLGDIDFGARTDGTVTAKIRGIAGNNGNGTDGQITFFTADNTASQAAEERMRIASNGDILFNTTSVADLTNNAFTFDESTGRVTICSTGSTEPLIVNRHAGDGTLIEMRRSNSVVGSISVTASATAYNTSSDQRLKDNIVDAPSASDDIDAIQVRSFDWKADGSRQKYGMVAQELQSVAPEAVSGNADSEDMMGVDYSKLVPMMLKEIQSLRARVAQLEGET